MLITVIWSALKFLTSSTLAAEAANIPYRAVLLPGWYCQGGKQDQHKYLAGREGETAPEPWPLQEVETLHKHRSSGQVTDFSSVTTSARRPNPVTHTDSLCHFSFLLWGTTFKLVLPDMFLNLKDWAFPYVIILFFFSQKILFHMNCWSYST